jgi:5-methyltetrahydrofolate--homocysteine methyltransferase
MSDEILTKPTATPASRKSAKVTHAIVRHGSVTVPIYPARAVTSAPHMITKQTHQITRPARGVSLVCPIMSDTHPLGVAVIAGKRKEIPDLVATCISVGESAQFIVENRLVSAMAVVGEKFKNNEIFVPEMLIAARAMKEALKILEPMLVEAGVRPEFNAVIGTVEGDLHDIGKNLVAMMWKGANIDVIDLGVNVPPAKFVEAIRENNARLVGLSALLTTTMPAMRETVKAIRDAGLSPKIMIGGAPITIEYASEIGADGYAADAGSAVDAAMALLKS